MIFKKGLTPHELSKPIRKGQNANSGLSRSEVLVQKIENGDKLQLINSEESVQIECLTSEQKETILSGNRSRILTLRLVTVLGRELKLSDLAKTEEFGSYKPEMTGENNQVKILDTHIKMCMDGDPVDIFLGPFDFKGVRGARQITERMSGKLPKADVALHDGEKDVAWFSMKTNRYDNPRDNQQYSGISAVSGIHVSEADETKEFISDVKNYLPNGVAPGMSVSKDIHSESLKIHAVFGSESLYEDFGVNKCHAVIHGVPSLVPTHTGRGHELRASGKIILFGQVPKDGYEPIFVACYRTDRNSAGIPHTRIMIYPRDGRKTNEVL